MRTALCDTVIGKHIVLIVLRVSCGECSHAPNDDIPAAYSRNARACAPGARTAVIIIVVESVCRSRARARANSATFDLRTSERTVGPLSPPRRRRVPRKSLVDQRRPAVTTATTAFNGMTHVQEYEKKPDWVRLWSTAICLIVDTGGTGRHTHFQPISADASECSESMG